MNPHASGFDVGTLGPLGQDPSLRRSDRLKTAGHVGVRATLAEV